MGLTQEPITRKERYYSYLLGEDVSIDEPITREERYLYALCKQGAGGAGGTTDYNGLSNKPLINGVELTGDVALEDIITDGNEVAY